MIISGHGPGYIPYNTKLDSVTKTKKKVVQD